MADLNRYLVQKDRERIESYIERRNLKMTESPSGLWYMIKSEGNGELFYLIMTKLLWNINVLFLTGQAAILQKRSDQKRLFWEEAKWKPD